MTVAALTAVSTALQYPSIGHPLECQLPISLQHDPLEQMHIRFHVQSPCWLFRNMMQEATDPSGNHSPRHLSCSQSISVGALRPMIAHSQALLGQAEKEPPFMGRHRMLLSKWRPVLASLEALITKVAALESLLEGTLLLICCCCCCCF